MPEARSMVRRPRPVAGGAEPRRYNDAGAPKGAPRSHRGLLMAAAYAIFGLVLFVAFLAGTFPYGDTIASMLKPLNLTLVYQKQRMHFPIGAKLAGVRLLSTASRPYQMVLQSPRVILAPTIGSLLFGRPGLRVRAEIYGGTVGATIHQRAGLADVAFTMDSLSLRRAEPLQQFGAEFDGMLSGAGTADLGSPDLASNTAHLALDGRGVTVRVIDGFPAMRLGVVTGVAALSDGTITLNDVEAHGDDAALEAQGTIQLAPDAADSTINLTVSLTPTPAGRNRFGLFINMLPHAPARGPYYINGPLMSPSVN